MANVSVAICETFDGPVAGFGDGPGDCTGILLNRLHSSVRVPGRGLNFEVRYRDSRIEGPDNEFSFEFHVTEQDLNAMLERGRPDLIGACKRWIEEHAASARSARPYVLAARYFEPQPSRLAA
ncbi:MAG: hypothetical protein FJX62_03750 [Alphaproteobacteria bacterium]|nr:hypothetical protein [Alphaproteobacteria bacterium]